MDDCVAVALLRHGLTEANRRKVYLGWTDSPLILGEAERLAERSAELPSFERVYASDLGRCQRTAEHLFPSQTIQSLPEFREMDFGIWEGRNYKELAEDSSYQHFLKHPEQAAPTGGETLAAFEARVRKGFETLLIELENKGIHRAAVVAHGGVIRLLMAEWAAGHKDMWEWEVPYGGGYLLTWADFQSARRGDRCISSQAVPITAKPNGQEGFTRIDGKK